MQCYCFKIGCFILPFQTF